MRAAERHGCDLIVTGVARHEPLGRLVLGSTVERLARRSYVPVLVVRKRGHRPYRHVVAATDFSEASRHALEAVDRFFPSARLTVFHAFDVPMRPLAADSAGYVQQFRDAAAQSGEEFLKQVDLAGSPGRKPELLLEDGEPDRLLHDYARDMDVDLVALGSHGRSGLRDSARQRRPAAPQPAAVRRAPRQGAASGGRRLRSISDSQAARAARRRPCRPRERRPDRAQAPRVSAARTISRRIASLCSA